MTNNSKQLNIILVLFLVIAIDTMGISIAWPIFGTLFTGKASALFDPGVSMQWRNALYGITLGIASLFMFLGGPILGDISDKIGRRRVLFFCLIGTSFGMGLSIIGIMFNQLFLIILSRALIGAVAASQIIAQATIIDISNQQNKASLLGVVSAANNMGFILGPIVGGILIDKTVVSWFGFTTPFCFAAILALFNAALLLKTYKETIKTKVTKKIQFANSFKVFIRAFKNKNIRTLAYIYVCFQIGWALYLHTHFLALIQKYHYSGSKLSYFSLWMGLIFCVNLFFVIRIITRFVTAKQIICFALPVAAVCCITAIYNNETRLWLGFLPMITAISLGGNAIVTTFSNMAAKTEQGWAMGISNGLTALSWAIAPSVAGILFAIDLKIPLTVAGILFVLGSVIAVVFLRGSGLVRKEA